MKRFTEVGITARFAKAVIVAMVVGLVIGATASVVGSEDISQRMFFDAEQWALGGDEPYAILSQVTDTGDELTASLLIDYLSDSYQSGDGPGVEPTALDEVRMQRDAIQFGEDYVVLAGDGPSDTMGEDISVAMMLVRHGSIVHVLVLIGATGEDMIDPMIELAETYLPNDRASPGLVTVPVFDPDGRGLFALLPTEELTGMPVLAEENY